MSLSTKITLLFLLLFALMATCVYMHIDDFTPTAQTTATNKEETIVLTPSENSLEEAQIKHTVDNIQKIEESNAQKEEKVDKTEDALKKDEETEKSVEVQEDATAQNEVLSANKQSVQEQINAILEEQGIIFKRMSYNVSTQSFDTIKEIAKIIKQHPSFKYEVAGHTDAKGDKAFNQMVSQQRAKSVRQVLIDLGIRANTLTAKGYGEANPIVPNDPQGYSLVNRRVEINIIED